MSEETITSGTADVTAEVSDSTSAAPSDTEQAASTESADTTDDASATKGSSRDARNRVELKAAKERLKRMQRSEVERIAATKLASAADVWLDGLTLDALLNEDGDLDAEKLDAHLDALLEARPHWKSAPKAGLHPRRGGMQSGAVSPGQQRSPSWASAIRSAGKSG